MRSTQLMGLPRLTSEFLKANRVKQYESKTCECCGHTEVTCKSEPRVWKDAADEGMFGDGPELYEYVLDDGRVVREEVQAVPWSSGPCIFLKLIDSDGVSLFEWSDEEIEAAL